MTVTVAKYSWLKCLYKPQKLILDLFYLLGWLKYPAPFYVAMCSYLSSKLLSTSSQENQLANTFTFLLTFISIVGGIFMSVPHLHGIKWPLKK